MSCRRPNSSALNGLVRLSNAAGLLLLAALMLSAMAAPVARAEVEGQFVSAEAPSTGAHVASLIEANHIGEESPFTFTILDGTEVHCTHFGLLGTIGQGTEKELTLEPDFGAAEGAECQVMEISTTVTTNGCHLVLGTVETGPEQEWSATTDLRCPEMVDGIEVHLYFEASHGFIVCTSTIPPQSNMEGITIAENANGEAPDDLTMTVDLDMAETSSGVCGHDTGTAELTGEATVTAESHVTSEALDLFIEHTAE